MVLRGILIAPTAVRRLVVLLIAAVDLRTLTLYVPFEVAPSLRVASLGQGSSVEGETKASAECALLLHKSLLLQVQLGLLLLQETAQFGAQSHVIVKEGLLGAGILKGDCIRVLFLLRGLL